MCRTDREALCADLRFLGQESMGGNAEYVLVMDDNLAKLPDPISFDAIMAALQELDRNTAAGGGATSRRKRGCDSSPLC